MSRSNSREIIGCLWLALAYLAKGHPIEWLYVLFALVGFAESIYYAMKDRL